MPKFRVKSGIVEIESKDPYMRSFLVSGELGNVRINVWESGSTYTVGTYMNHPKKGKTQLFRRGLNLPEVMEILKNPRKHTGKGYRTKAELNR